jgi:hypothetical protein
MRINKSTIRRIIMEEASRALREGDDGMEPDETPAVRQTPARRRVQDLYERIKESYPGGVKRYKDNMLNQEYPDLTDEAAVEEYIGELRGMFASTLEKMMSVQTQLYIIMQDLDEETPV